MRRREFIRLLGGGTAAWPIIARAQQAPVHPIIAVLSPISSAAATRNIEALRTGLRDLGYSEGRNITLEIRYADGAIERLAELVAELVALKPAVIVVQRRQLFPVRQFDGLRKPEVPRHRSDEPQGHLMVRTKMSVDDCRNR